MQAKERRFHRLSWAHLAAKNEVPKTMMRAASEESMQSANDQFSLWSFGLFATVFAIKLQQCFGPYFSN
jgi:hypothetical protein